MKRKKTRLLALSLLFLFAACGGDDGGSTNNGNGGEGNPELSGKLLGTWQAIQAQGTYYDWTFNTTEISGIDSLNVPGMVIINPNNTYISYNATFAFEDYSYINGIFVPFKHIWQQRGNHGGGAGEGSVLLIGNNLQLNDRQGSYYSYAFNISKLTSNRLVISVQSKFEDFQVTYGRDGDGVKYYQYPYINKNPSLVGSWTLAECSENGAPIGAVYTFNNNGTGQVSNEPFTYTLNPTGEFTIDMNGGRRMGRITVTSTTVYGYYSYQNSTNQYYIKFIRNRG